MVQRPLLALLHEAGFVEVEVAENFMMGSAHFQFIGDGKTESKLKAVCALPSSSNTPPPRTIYTASYHRVLLRARS